MPTLTAQWVISLSVVAFSLLALRIGREMAPRAPAFAAGWAFTGTAFLILGLNAAFHDLFSTLAFLSGPESWLWSAVISVHPVLNHSRTFGEIAFSVLLSARLLRRSPTAARPRLATGVGLLVLAIALGGVVGAHEEAFSGLTHYTAVAIWDILALLSMFVLLFIGISTGQMDRSLWFCLGLLAFALAFSVIAFAALSRVDLQGQWHPQPVQIHAAKGLLYLAVCYTAFRQLSSIRRHEPVRGFFEDRHRMVLPS